MPSTPFFSSLLPLLFGRAPRSAAEKLRRQFQQFTSVSQLQEAFGSYIPQALLSPCAKGINSRQRLFSTSITFWAFLAQVLSPTCSCREATRKIQAWFSLRCAKAPKALSSDS